jgi:hypothetical protein
LAAIRFGRTFNGQHKENPMEKTITEIRFYGPGIGYGTEMVNANGQAAIKYHTVTEGREGRSDTQGRR